MQDVYALAVLASAVFRLRMTLPWAPGEAEGSTTPWSFMQLVNALMADAFALPFPAPPPLPCGRRLAHACAACWNAGSAD